MPCQSSGSASSSGTYIRRGTTPKQVFTFKNMSNPASAKEIVITYEQRGKEILEKRKDDLTIEDNVVWFRMTQQETLSLKSNVDVEVQIRVLTSDDTAPASIIFSLPVERILNEEVLT